MKSVAATQVLGSNRSSLKLVAILEEKRHNVMANDRAGYFIHDWQELTDQVREIIVKDTRFGRITASQTARKHAITIIGPREQNYKLKERAFINPGRARDQALVYPESCSAKRFLRSSSPASRKAAW